MTTPGTTPTRSTFIIYPRMNPKQAQIILVFEPLADIRYYFAVNICDGFVVMGLWYGNVTFCTAFYTLRQKLTTNLIPTFQGFYTFFIVRSLSGCVSKHEPPSPGIFNTGNSWPLHYPLESRRNKTHHRGAIKYNGVVFMLWMFEPAKTAYRVGVSRG